ncbi:uncharacterized protein LOC123011388 [Tribolium madens]|uniref:uncharacterized protein LOC123011388 n=1 Tax=Tribolium madens TaxID=41895 RepID=UPI001CF74C9F|nr:uncharacterized protein LOC123011388 [Tribolium madens]
MKEEKVLLVLCIILLNVEYYGVFSFVSTKIKLPKYTTSSSFQIRSFNGGFSPLFSSNGLPSLFPSSEFSSFPSIDHLGFDIEKNFEKTFKPMKLTQAKTSMGNGIGGVTIIDAGGKQLIKKDGTLFECFGEISTRQPFCLGELRRFQIKSRHDFCYSEHYSKINNFLCIGQPDHTGITFNSVNGKYSCRGSDERPAILMAINEYQNLCGKLPWGNTYYYFPDQTHPFHVHLPDPSLKCRENRPDVCVFKLEHK